MDKLLSVHQRKATKQTKNKKKPIKVVYISNPMKVMTNASDFRALVQELTGQDADMPDHTKFSESTDDVGGHQMVPDAMKMVEDHALEVPRVDSGSAPAGRSNNLPSFEPFDDVFSPMMLENFTGLLQGSLLYESPQVDVLRSLDAV